METLFGNVSHLLRRRWYIVIAMLLLGAVTARVISDTEVSSAEILHVESVADRSLALGLVAFPEAPSATVALQAQADLSAAPDKSGITGTISWDEAARSITISITGSSVDLVAAAAHRIGTEVSERIEKLVADQIAVALADADTQVTQLEDAATAIEKFVDGLAPTDTTRSVLLATAADLRSDGARAAARRTSLGSMQSVVSSLIESNGAIVTTSEPGFTTYAAGALAAGALLVLGACGWVLADRRIRRRVHLDRAAPGVRDLGLVGTMSPGFNHIDVAVLASVKSFARDAGATTIILFGVPRGSAAVSALADALQPNVDFRVEATVEPAAGAVRDDLHESVGYVAVVRWGKTTEGQLSAAVADIHSVGGLPLAVLLIGVPGRERSWAGASLVDVAPSAEVV